MADGLIRDLERLRQNESTDTTLRDRRQPSNPSIGQASSKKFAEAPATTIEIAGFEHWNGRWPTPCSSAPSELRTRRNLQQTRPACAKNAKLLAVATWLFVGAISGNVVKLVLPRREGRTFGIVAAAGLGAVGAFAGSHIGRYLGWGTVHGFDLQSFALASIGSMLVLSVAHKVTS
jgi:uncharacterized membrane protein YeaQ/YmgE (transglycosylase-associated protein family)